MTRKIAIRFDSDDTIIACSRNEGESPTIISLPPLSPRDIPETGADITFTQVIPSVIHYGPEGKTLVGGEVAEAGLCTQVGTLHHLRDHILLGRSARIRIGETTRTYESAGENYLHTIFTALRRENLLDSSVDLIMTIPTGAPERYTTWLPEVVAGAGIPEVQLIDEGSAAALGYGMELEPGMLFSVTDWGVSSAEAMVLQVEPGNGTESHHLSRVISRASMNRGLGSVDRWLLEETLAGGNQIPGTVPDSLVRTDSLRLCRRAWESLLVRNSAELQIPDPGSRTLVTHTWTRESFQEMLERRDFFRQTCAMFSSLFNEAQGKGYSARDIAQVLVTGSSSHIPFLKEEILSRFGNIRVLDNHPREAVPFGAVRFGEGALPFGRIGHDYALRYWSFPGNCHKYRVIVHKGTPYPSRDVISRIIIRAVFDGQTKFALPVYAMKENGTEADHGFELIPDPDGAMRLGTKVAAKGENPVLRCVNEKEFALITTFSPGIGNENHLELAFTLDSRRRLLVTARDRKNLRAVVKEMVVATLT